VSLLENNCKEKKEKKKKWVDGEEIKIQFVR